MRAIRFAAYSGAFIGAVMLFSANLHGADAQAINRTLGLGLVTLCLPVLWIVSKDEIFV